MNALLAVFAGLLGAALGSFANVVIHRVPRAESVVSPPSRCPSCGTTLRPRDNIPVISWVLLRGRCRSCGTAIPARYPLIELSTAALWVAAALRFENLEEAAFVALGSSVLLMLAAIDLEHHRLPNAIVYPAFAVSAVWVALAAGLRGDPRIAVESGASAGAYFLVLLTLAVATSGRGMGMGDVKLAALLGLMAGRFGWEVAVGAVMAAFLGGGLVAVLLLATGRAGRKTRIPFGPALAGGAVLAVFAGPGPVRAWLGL